MLVTCVGYCDARASLSSLHYNFCAYVTVDDLAIHHHRHARLLCDLKIPEPPIQASAVHADETESITLLSDLIILYCPVLFQSLPGLNAVPVSVTILQHIWSFIQTQSPAL